MADKSNIEIIREWYATLNPDIVDENVDWELADGFPADGHYHGRQAVFAEWWPKLAAQFDRIPRRGRGDHRPRALQWARQGDRAHVQRALRARLVDARRQDREARPLYQHAPAPPGDHGAGRWRGERRGHPMTAGRLTAAEAA
jgi:hypothetical protein